MHGCLGLCGESSWLPVTTVANLPCAIESPLSRALPGPHPFTAHGAPRARVQAQKSRSPGCSAPEPCPAPRPEARKAARRAHGALSPLSARAGPGLDCFVSVHIQPRSESQAPTRIAPCRRSGWSRIHSEVWTSPGEAAWSSQRTPPARPSAPSGPRWPPRTPLAPRPVCSTARLGRSLRARKRSAGASPARPARPAGRARAAAPSPGRAGCNNYILAIPRSSGASREQQQPLPGEAWLQNPAPATSLSNRP